MDTQLLVLGGGPGGYAAAFMAADLGMQVVLVDAEPPWAASACSAAVSPPRPCSTSPKPLPTPGTLPSGASPSPRRRSTSSPCGPERRRSLPRSPPD